MFDAPAGIVAIFEYPIAIGVSTYVLLTGLHTVVPQRTEPLFMNAPVIMPLLWTACCKSNEKLKEKYDYFELIPA